MRRSVRSWWERRAICRPSNGLGGAIDPRSDIFSMGSVLHEMLSGQQCFAAANLVATTHKILHEPPASLLALRPDLPAGIVQVAETALAKRPDDRFQNAADMAQALRSALRSQGLADPADDDSTMVGPGSRSRPAARAPSDLAAVAGGFAYRDRAAPGALFGTTRGLSSTPRLAWRAYAGTAPGGFSPRSSRSRARARSCSTNSTKSSVPTAD